MTRDTFFNFFEINFDNNMTGSNGNMEFIIQSPNEDLVMMSDGHIFTFQLLELS